MKPSKQAEVYYRKHLDNLIAEMQKIAIEELQNDTLNDALFSKGVSLLSKQMQRMLERLESLDITSIAQRMSRNFISKLNQSNERSLKSNLANQVSVDLKGQIHNEGIGRALDVKIAENVALIKSIKNEYIEKVGSVVRQNVMEGQRSTNLITQIKEQGNVSKSRAKFIARDQTAKLNADLTQLRSDALGAKTYIWSGAMDERERTDHKAMEGKLCKWDDATVYSDDDGKTWKKRKSIGGVELHPGKDYNCRCVSLSQISWS